MTVQSLQKKTYSDDLLSGVFPSLRTRQGENLPHLKATVIANPKGEAILSRRQDCFGFASLKLGISDSIVEVSLEETIRLKEAELPRLMGLARNDVPLAWIATALSRLAMTRCQQGLLWLCIPETGNLRFHSGSIPGRDNSSKGTSSQDSWAAIAARNDGLPAQIATALHP